MQLCVVKRFYLRFKDSIGIDSIGIDSIGIDSIGIDAPCYHTSTNVEL